MAKHQIERVRHELRRRTLTVSLIEALTPHMLRIAFASPELDGFVSASADDHVKLFFPQPGAAADAKSPMRDFTPRSYDAAAGRLVIDFALHDSGPATSWAVQAKAGDVLQIAGPRGSVVVPDDFDWYLLIGDDTALPSIGRRVEEARPGMPVATFVITSDDGSALRLSTRAAWSPTWLTRGVGNDADVLIAALESFVWPEGDGFVWIAAEASVARTLKTYVVEQRGQQREWVKAAGYWQRGEADAHVKIED